MSLQDYYGILGVSKTADKAEIKSGAYLSELLPCVMRILSELVTFETGFLVQISHFLDRNYISND